MFRKVLLTIKTSFISAKDKEAGISLIEVAMGLIVLGLIAAPIMQTYRVNVVQDSFVKTRAHMGDVVGAINQFFISNGKYPCPANVFLGEGDDDFGSSSADCYSSGIKACNGPWEANGGVCRAGGGGPNAVIIGAVPFASLRMQQEKALDIWGNKIIYAVTMQQTDSDDFLGNNGAITVLAVDNPKKVADGVAGPDGDGVPGQVTDTIDFFLYSTGKSAIGGYTKDGLALSSCGDSATGYESENCDWDTTFFYSVDPNDPEASSYSEVVGSIFFDDITMAQESPPENLWFQHPDNVDYDDEFVITLSDKIGIGTSEPEEAVDVIGGVRTDNQLMSDVLCDNPANLADQRCFDPEIITGTMGQMRCDSDDSLYGDQAVMRLANNQVYCNSAENSAGNIIEGSRLKVDTNVIVVFSCDAGEMANGIKANGELNCIIP